MRSIFNVAIKDLRLLWRDKLGMFWVLFFPLLMAVFFGSLFGGLGRRSPLTVVIVDEDQTDRSRAFIERLHNADTIKLLTPEGFESTPQDTIDPARIGSYDLEEAQGLVRLSNVAAYVRMKKGFGESLGFMANVQDLELGIDPVRRVEAGILQGVIMESFTAPIRELTKDPAVAKKTLEQARKDVDKSGLYTGDKAAGIKSFLRAFERLVVPQEEAANANDPVPASDEATTDMPETPRIAEDSNADDSSASNMLPTSTKVVEVRREHGGPSSGYEISFPQSITWGIFGCLSVFAISLVQERTQGTYLRLRVAPISRAQILAGKGLACWLACCAVSILLIIFGRIAFGIRVDNYLTLAMAVAASSACFVGIMMFASVMGRTERAVGGSVWAINMPLAMLGGSMIPLVVMPPWMQAASNVSPVMWMIRALEGAVWRGFSFEEMLLPCAILLIFGAVAYAIGLLILLRRDA